MTKPKHTPGPWSYVDAEGYNTIEGQGETIAYVPSIEDFRANFKTLEGQANRRLIAAAPELYDLLDKINTAFYTRTSRKEWLAIMEQTKPLLRKARGEL